MKEIFNNFEWHDTIINSVKIEWEAKTLNHQVIFNIDCDEISSRNVIFKDVIAFRSEPCFIGWNLIYDAYQDNNDEYFIDFISNLHNNSPECYPGYNCYIIENAKDTKNYIIVAKDFKIK